MTATPSQQKTEFSPPPERKSFFGSAEKCARSPLSNHAGPHTLGQWSMDRRLPRWLLDPLPDQAPPLRDLLGDFRIGDAVPLWRALGYMPMREYARSRHGVSEAWVRKQADSGMVGMFRPQPGDKWFIWCGPISFVSTACADGLLLSKVGSVDDIELGIIEGMVARSMPRAGLQDQVNMLRASWVLRDRSFAWTRRIASEHAVDLDVLRRIKDQVDEHLDRMVDRAIGIVRERLQRGGLDAGIVEIGWAVSLFDEGGPAINRFLTKQDRSCDEDAEFIRAHLEDRSGRGIMELSGRRVEAPSRVDPVADARKSMERMHAGVIASMESRPLPGFVHPRHRRRGDRHKDAERWTEVLGFDASESYMFRSTNPLVEEQAARWDVFAQAPSPMLDRWGVTPDGRRFAVEFVWGCARGLGHDPASLASRVLRGEGSPMVGEESVREHLRQALEARNLAR